MGSSDQIRTIRAFCQACGAAHAFAVTAVGKKARCNTCGYVFRIPVLQAAAGAGEAGPGPPAVTAPTEEVSGRSAERPYDPVMQPVDLDPLAELAVSEEIAGGSPGVIPNHEVAAVIGVPPVDPRATVTAVTFMLGLVYLALTVVGLLLLGHFLGLVLSGWVLVPVVAVFGRPAITHIAFLMTGKASR